MTSSSPAPLIEMFTGPGCAYCAQARAILDARGLAYVEYDTAESLHRNEFSRRLPRSRSIPQLFIDGVHIGSFEDLQEWDQAGRLVFGAVD